MIILFIPYKLPSDIKGIREYESCLARNLSNELIDKIVLVTNEDISIPFDKCEVYKINEEPYPQVLIDIASKYDAICIIAPMNVYSDESLQRLYNVDWDRGIAFQLSTWTNQTDAWGISNSSEVLIFKGKLNDPWFFNPSADIKFYRIGDGFITAQEVSPHSLDIVKTKPLPKIFHIGQYSYFENGIRFADYKFFNWVNYTHNWILIPETKEKLEKRCLEGAKWSDIVFMQLQCPDIITMSLIKKMKEVNPKVKIYQFSGDVREEIPKCFTDIGSEVVSLFTNDVDPKKMRDMGSRSEYLQIGFPDDIFHPKGEVIINEPIVFMGGCYPDNNGKPHFPLSHERRDMVLFLKDKYGDKFGVYGNGWGGLETENITNHKKEASVYRGAKIGINYSHFNYSRYSSDRILRIMGSGCFCLTHKYPDIEKDFKIGYHLDVFENLTELKDKIDYYLVHEEERNKIEKQGAKYVLDTCTWERRFETLLKMKI